ncbi:MAG TPA: hypothetical protein VN841_19600 [Bryobacteraceae bacterium]|nr:hypothetical protein [Bryobacteraceae bacterium]
MVKPALMLAGVGLGLLVVPAPAQWLHYPDPKTPRTADGKANLSAPAPRRSDGKPDLSGIWMGVTKYMINIAADFKEGDVPFTPAGAAEYKRRRDTESKDDPSARCLPLSLPEKNTITSPFKIVNADGFGEILLLFEGQRPRQIFTDGRPLPADPAASWDGYSIGRWEGDDLVVESIGFNGKEWLDINGHPVTEALHLTERYHRKDFGRLSYDITIEDRNMYAKPWTVHEELHLLPDTELLEQVCENNLDVEHLVGK